MKQTQKERIDVDCVKNTAYRQTIVSLEHNYNERLKLSQLEDTEVTTKALKSKMMEKKKLLEDQPKIRLRDFYIIFTSRRPKIFCFFLKLLANVMPEDYEWFFFVMKFFTKETKIKCRFSRKLFMSDPRPESTEDLRWSISTKTNPLSSEISNWCFPSSTTDEKVVPSTVYILLVS